MTKILNLDDFNTPLKSIKLNGRDHPMKPMSVKDFITTTREAQALGADADMGAQIEQLVKMVRAIFPTFTDDDINGLDMPQLNKIIEFARAEEEATAEAEAKN